jgi:malate dehydrogenase (oxaloacetate-decarboxylating)
VTTATLLAAVNATGIPLREHTIAMFGTGSAGAGILDLLIAEMKREGLSDEQAHRRIYAFNHLGLLVEGCEGIRPAQQPFVRKREDVAGWKLSAPGTDVISLLDVARNADITVLVGVSAQPGAFTEEIVREMARHTPRPVIFPLSNPTSQCEAAPSDLLRWTEGRALVGTGSPFAPVEVNGKLVHIAQVNNSYIFPGLSLGILVSRARRVTDGMIMAAAKALASLSPARTDKSAPLLPPIADSRKTSAAVAAAVGLQAMAEGVADACNEAEFAGGIRDYVWEPEYQQYERIMISR